MPDIRRLLRIARIALLRRGLRRRNRPYRMAPPLAHPERLHHSTKRAVMPSPMNFDALRYEARLREVAGLQ